MRDWRVWLATSAALLAGLCGVRAAFAAASDGTGASYWGEIPPAADSVVVTPRNNRVPAWERTLLVPYAFAGLPLRAASAGVRETITFLDERRVLYHIGRLLRPRQGPFGVLVNVTAGGLAGFGGGVSAVHDAFLGRPGDRFKLYTQATTRGVRRTTLGIRIGALERGQFEIGAGYRLTPNARFFGIGPETAGADESRYTQELTWGGVSYNRPLGGHVVSELGVLLSAIGSRGPRDDDETPLAERYAGAIPAGYGERSDGVEASLALRHDTTVESGRPERGGMQRVKAAYFESIDARDLSYWSYRGDVEQFVPLWFSRRALALRGFLTWIDTVDEDEVPFQRLMTNDDPDLMRGFHDFRWRDRGMALATVEYRWPIWAEKRAEGLGVDAYLQSDVGQVFGEFDEIALPELTVSYGGGLRLLGVDGGFMGRLEYAVSREETVIRLRGDQVFQFARNGLFNGRNPIPIR